jgi:hypothetical protein
VIEVAEQRLRRRVWGNTEIRGYIESQLTAIESGATSPFGIADELLRRGADLLREP